MTAQTMKTMKVKPKNEGKLPLAVLSFNLELLYLKTAHPGNVFSSNHPTVGQGLLPFPLLTTEHINNAAMIPEDQQIAIKVPLSAGIFQDQSTGWSPSRDFHSKTSKFVGGRFEITINLWIHMERLQKGDILVDNSFSLEAGDELSKVSQLYSVDFHGKMQGNTSPMDPMAYGTCLTLAHVMFITLGFCIAGLWHFTASTKTSPLICCP